MDIAAIAAAAVALLTPYLVKAGEAVAKKAGETVWDKASELYQVLRTRFRGDPIKESALTDLQQMPEDGDTQASLRKELKKVMQDDPRFAEQLLSILKEAGQTETGATIISMAAGDYANQIGVVQGDVTMDRNEYSRDGAEGS